MMMLSMMFMNFFAYAYKIYGENSSPHPPISDFSLTVVASIGSGLVNGVTRLALGTIVDKVGFKKLFFAIMSIQLVLSLSVYYAAYIESIYFICIILNFFCQGGIFTIFPVATTNVFGLEVGAQAYVWILGSPIISSFANMLET